MPGASLTVWKYSQTADAIRLGARRKDPGRAAGGHTMGCATLHPSYGLLRGKGGVGGRKKEPSPLVPAGAHRNPARPLGGAKRH